MYFVAYLTRWSVRDVKGIGFCPFISQNFIIIFEGGDLPQTWRIWRPKIERGTPEAELIIQSWLSVFNTDEEIAVVF
jgi:hypothetical protein